MRSLLALSGLLILLTGCGTYESREYIALNDEERLCIQEQTVVLIANTPKSLAGHDQDWDDAIKAAHVTALEACCEARLFERTMINHKLTGKWRKL